VLSRLARTKLHPTPHPTPPLHKGARMVRELFQMARSKKACLIFFDEVRGSFKGWWVVVGDGA